MSTPELRPPRTTANYGWPIPGDAGPADYVTDTGDLADAIDATLGVGGGVPLITPGQLSQAPYINPRDGQIVDVLIDAANWIIWRFRWHAAIGDAHRWVFIGGQPLEAYATGLTNGGANQWGAMTPVMPAPRPGFYRLFVSANAQNTGAAQIWRALLSAYRGGAGSTPLLGPTSTTGFADLTPNTVTTIINYGTFGPVVVGENIGLLGWVTGPINQTTFVNRGMQLTPLRVS